MIDPSKGLIDWWFSCWCYPAAQTHGLLRRILHDEQQIASFSQTEEVTFALKWSISECWLQRCNFGFLDYLAACAIIKGMHIYYQKSKLDGVENTVEVDRHNTEITFLFLQVWEDIASQEDDSILDCIFQLYTARSSWDALLFDSASLIKRCRNHSNPQCMRKTDWQNQWVCGTVHCKKDFFPSIHADRETGPLEEAVLELYRL